ncbi:PD-(D/E)XK motif protein [Pseudoclavibacter helvolus]|uniref:PD-(D/E)XK motif protein n=1 Tax=Pseudoclavibacter helvolus TaxID=255205 RepID=UPI000A6F6459|nr:PD-(D/E)XK motif protein [Pseudoclavibacter helvolus]
MTPNESHPMHLDPRTVEEYFRLGAKTAFELIRAPVVRMEIDPSQESIELTTPAVGANPEVASLERLSVARYWRGNSEWFRLRVDARNMHYESYALIEAVADTLRSGGSLRHAVSESLASFRDLLSSRGRLTDEKAVGLAGELLLLQHAIKSSGEKAAIESWLGPMGEEHDFCFRDFDVEVKTTRSESRTHVISSDTQLEPSPGRPLYLVSIQVTRAGSAVQSFTLPSLISDIDASLEDSKRTFHSAVEAAGWRDGDDDLYVLRYQLRSEPRAYLVDETFPAITSARLQEFIPSRINITSVSYRVNVSDRAFTRIGSPLTRFCEERP